jgi:2-oxoglutarate ferredoxin oxidoreductase subunit beta
VDPSVLLVHDEYAESPNLAFLLSRMVNPAFPVPIGVFRQVSHPTYEQGVIGQVTQARKSRGVGKLSDLYSASDTWTIKAQTNGHEEDDANGHFLYGGEG